MVSLDERASVARHRAQAAIFTVAISAVTMVGCGCHSGQGPCQVDVLDFPAGVDDQLVLPTEPAAPSAGLQAGLDQYPGQSGRAFDETGSDRVFGHTFANLRPDPILGTICGATLTTRLMPMPGPIGNGSNTWNDAMVLGHWDPLGNRSTLEWARPLGNGVFSGGWGPSNPLAPWATARPAEQVVLDLAALPNADGSTTDLIGLLVIFGSLDLYIQDDTFVDYATLTVTYCCPEVADLAVQKTALGIFQAGQLASYDIDVTNTGTVPFSSPITVVDELPVGLTFDSYAGADWSCSAVGQMVTCIYTGPDVNPGDSLPALVINAQVSTNAGPFVENCATLDNPTDADETNDRSCIVSPIVVAAVAPDLAITKSPKSTFHYGQPASYLIGVENVGTGPAAPPITVIDDLPPGMTFTGFTGTGWACTASGQLVTCIYTGAAVPAGGALPDLVINVDVGGAASLSGSSEGVSNCATVQHPADTNASNDTDCAVVRIRI